MRKWLIGFLVVPLATAATIYGIGLALPSSHIARGEAVLAAAPESVAALIRDVEAHPNWRKSVRGVEILERRERFVRYVEHSDSGVITFDFYEEIPARRFRSVIADPRLPFSGFWIIDVLPSGAGTRLTIVEHGRVDNPVFRFFSTLVFGHEATMQQYLADLTKAAGR